MKKAHQTEVINYLMAPYEKVFKGHPSNKMVRAQLESLSLEQFSQLMVLAEEGKWNLPFYIPVLKDDAAVNKEKMLKLADACGVKLFEQLVLVDDATGEEYKTPIEYLSLTLPVRRQIQHLVKKMSVSEDNQSLDHLTGQVTGDSKASSLSMPELLALEARGLDNVILELIKVRGGDAEALRHMEQNVIESGGYSLRPIEELGTTAKVNHTLSSILFAMGYDDNLVQ